MHAERRVVLAATSIAVVLLATSPARADPASDAKDLFTRGRELRARGDCAAAVAPFRKAHDLYPAGLGSLRNLAECEEQLGHFASSWRAWIDLKRSLLTTSDTKYDGWAQDAEQAAARLRPKLATLTVDVRVVTADGAAVAGQSPRVTLDGEPLAPELLGTELQRDPGHHVVHAEGPAGTRPQEQAVDLSPGDKKPVALRFVVSADAAGAPATPPGPPADAPSPDDGRRTRRLVGWIGVGVGAAALVGAGVSLVVRQSALDDVNGQCPSGAGCAPSLSSTVSRGQLAATLVNVLGGVGIVAVGGGLALVLTNRDPAPTTGFVVTPAPGGATATWRF